MTTYCFGPFELRPDGTLLRDGRALDLPPKQQGLLEVLVTAGQRVVSKREILDRLWPGEDVSEASLTTCVRGLRLVLGDTGRRGGHLETVHGSGYRFHATERAADPDVVRVAVAPFACEDDADRYLAEGLAGEVAAGLHRWRDEGIEAVARESAERGWQRDRERGAFAQRLALDFVATGRVLGAAGGVRVAFELVRVEGAELVWSGEFASPASEGGLVAAEIAEALAKRILAPRGRALRTPVAPSPLSADPRAYHALLRGYFLNQYRSESGLRRSLACFEQAVGWDPQCAAAHAALGETYLNLGWRGYAAPAEVVPLARQAVARALAVDPTSSLAHAGGAMLSALVDRDGRAVDAALAFRRNDAGSHDRLGAFAYVAVGRNEQALALAEAGLVLDPLSPNLAMARTVSLWFGGRVEEALFAARSLAEAEPEFPLAHAVRGTLAATLGRHDEALQCAKTADTLGRGDQQARTGAAWVFGRMGERDAARAILDSLERRAQVRYVSPGLMAVGYAGLDDLESALRWLARADEQRCLWLAMAFFDPRLAELRRDPRCVELLQGAGGPRRRAASPLGASSAAASDPRAS